MVINTAFTGSGTYDQQNSTTVTVTSTAHGLSTGNFNFRSHFWDCC